MSGNFKSSFFEDSSDEDERSKSLVKRTRLKRGTSRSSSTSGSNGSSLVKKKRTVNAKEAEILQRQRQFASKINAGKKLGNGKAVSNSSSSAKATTRAAPTATSGRTNGSGSTHTHPLLRKSKPSPMSSPPLTAALAVAAARNRLKLPSSDDNTSKSSVKNNATSTLNKKIIVEKPVPKITSSNMKRASMMKRTPAAKLRLAISDDKFPTFAAEDFWRMVRNWDFLNAMDAHMKPQNLKPPHKKNVHATKQTIPNQLKSESSTEVKGVKGTSSSFSDGQSVNEDKSNEVIKKKDDIIPHNIIPQKQKDENSSILLKTNEVPDTFYSVKQYIAVWAPLCLQEARAQLLSELSSSHMIGRSKKPFFVKVSSFRKDVGGTTDFIHVQIKSKGGSDGVKNRSKEDSTFLCNDIVLLASDSISFTSALQGKLSERFVDASNAKLQGLLGQVEHTRRSPDGLSLRISRKLWSTIGTPEMYLVKLGANVTAMREFTALCRTGTIPLIHDIIRGRGQKPKVSSSADQNNETGKVGPSLNNKDDLIARMGGTDALGKGFASYASEKYNQSQLGAIAASAQEYGEGGFTLVKGPPGTGKTTTLVAILNSLHIRQFNKYYEDVRKVAAAYDPAAVSKTKESLYIAAKKKPRLLVCAPSNAAIDNVIMKIMSSGFVDGNGSRYNPSMVRIGVGQSATVKDVALEAKVDALLSERKDISKLEASIVGYRVELVRIQNEISKLRRRIQALSVASPWPLSKEWEIRIDEETFDRSGRVFFVNHKEKRTTFEIPPSAQPGQQQYLATSMPEYRAHMATVVKLVERYSIIASRLERTGLVQTVAENLARGSGSHNQSVNSIRQQLEIHLIDSAHIVLTTLGTAGSHQLESASKFEVVVIDEAAQSVEPATLVALQLGSSHAILVGDPQQLPATIFSMSGRNNKYDRSLFQRLEEAGTPVHMLDTQYRMHPCISDFPRRIFYDGNLLDGPNVKHPEYGNPLRNVVISKLRSFQPFTILDLDSKEERGGTSLSNSSEARLALHLYCTLDHETCGLSAKNRVAVITPYAQQAGLLKRTFSQRFGDEYTRRIEVNTVDAFQGRESDIVIFSCVRAAGSNGIGFLSDVQRMNVALTRAKYFLFVIMRCQSIVVNPYWRDLVENAKENNAVLPVRMIGPNTFADLRSLIPMPPLRRKITSVIKRDSQPGARVEHCEDGEIKGPEVI